MLLKEKNVLVYYCQRRNFSDDSDRENSDEENSNEEN